MAGGHLLGQGSSRARQEEDVGEGDWRPLVPLALTLGLKSLPEGGRGGGVWEEYPKHKGACVYLQKIPEHHLQLPFYPCLQPVLVPPLAMLESCSFLALNLPLLPSLSLPTDSSSCLQTPSEHLLGNTFKSLPTSNQ